MTRDNVRFCEICREEFIPNRPWQKYCKKEECQNKAKSRNVTKWRKKKRKQLYLQDITLEDMKTKEPYKTIYENLLDFRKHIQKKGEPLGIPRKRKHTYTGFSRNELCRKFGIGDTFLCGWYLKAFTRLGILKLARGRYSLSDRYLFESLRLRQRDIITTTETKSILYRTLEGHSYFYYMPNFDIETFIGNIENIEDKIEQIEGLLKEAQVQFIKILDEARKNIMRKYWVAGILDNKKIHVLTKFIFCIDLIIKLRELDLILASPPKKSLNDQLDGIYSIFEKAFDQFLKNKYPRCTSDIIKQLHQKIDNDYEKYDGVLDQIWNKILAYAEAPTLEHLLVVDLPILDLSRTDEFAELGILRKAPLDRSQPIEMTKTKLKESERTQKYDRLTIKEPAITDTKKLCVKPPFFKDFFEGYENDLLNLGFKPGDFYYGIGELGVERYYKTLDEMANIIRIPLLPKELGKLL